MRNVVVHCGGATGPRVPAGIKPLVLKISLHKGRDRPLVLSLAQITDSMMANLPPRLWDLLEIACYVHAADQLSPRDGAHMPHFGEDWCRNFQFRIAVRAAEFWNRPAIRTALSETLGFVSGDTFDFRFTPALHLTAQTYLQYEGLGPRPDFRPQAVILFSGGLDSFAGATEALLQRKQQTVLLSHHASKLIQKVQATLASALRERTAKDQFLHVGVGVNRGSGEAAESSQRTRSFLFATLGLVVARLFGLKEVSFYENGVVSLNLPLAGHVLGTRATRTTHPRTLRDLGVLFSQIVETDIRLVNPFFWNTKADIVRKIADAGCASLISQTFSCAAVRAASFLGHQHCGVCSQCLDRRFGVLAAGCGSYERAESYAVDLLRTQRKPGVDTIMAESYLLSAMRHAGSSEFSFLTSHAEVLRAVPYLDLPPTVALRRLHELHQRHGQAVQSVVDRELVELRSLSDHMAVPQGSLLSMILAPEATDIEVVDPVETEPSLAEQVDLRAVPMMPRPITFSVERDRHRVTLCETVIVRGVQADVIVALMPNYLAGLQAGKGAAGFAYVTADDLAGGLRTDSPALRQQIARLRKGLTASFIERFGVQPASDDVIQNESGKGYRLNPYLSLTMALLQAKGQPSEST